MKSIVTLVPLFPLIGFLINGLFRKKLSKSMTGMIGCGVVGISFVLSLLIFNKVRMHVDLPAIYDLFPFIQSRTLTISFAFRMDELSSLFLLIVTGVGFLIHVYSTAYMKEESSDHYARYFSYMNLFVFSMLLLVLGANFVIMFIGWEGVGLCSYLLIGYWFKNTEYGYAARKAFIMNRIGDLGFLLAIFWIYSQFKSVDFLYVYHLAPTTPVSTLTGITLLLFVGAMGKSAQIPLYTWLPDAMAGPTPVSALIHAATMVTAGIYMIARTNIMYTLAPVSQTVVAVVGLATVILGATIALKQNDIKKVLAYSTVSQLGYMFLALGVGAYDAAVFHVMTHAFFKALLFLCAGSVIHAMHHEQDIRRMGGLKKYLPLTHATFLVGCLAISGIPPFSGFFSKDEILAAAYARNPVYYVLGVASAFLTAFYMFRLYATTFLGSFRGTQEQEKHLHESPAAMTIPLAVLALLATLSGFLGIPPALAANANWLQHFTHSVFEKSGTLDAAAHPAEQAPEMMLMVLSVVLAVIASVIAWARYSRHPETGDAKGFGRVLQQKWYVDEIYDAVIVKPIQAFARFLNNVVEKSIIDWMVNGIGKAVQYGSRQIRLLQSGQVGAYVLMMVIGIVIFFLVELFLKK